MRVKGICEKIGGVERAITIRVALPIIIKNVTSYIDYAVIVSRLVEVTWDSSYRKPVISCIKNNSDNKSRFCCILGVLGLSNLREKYCRL
jgi:hypothetical protein